VSVARISLAAAVAIVIAVVACSSDAAKGPSCAADEAGCTCTVGSPGGACSPATVKDALCCASSGWPGSGTCSCAAVTCNDDGATCTCARGLGGALTSCSGALCCQQTSGDCYCRRSSAGAPTCNVDDVASAFCRPSTLRCSPGTTKVDSCSSIGS
jgi:hypothetical protein